MPRVKTARKPIAPTLGVVTQIENDLWSILLGLRNGEGLSWWKIAGKAGADMSHLMPFVRGREGTRPRRGLSAAAMCGWLANLGYEVKVVAVENG